MVSLPSLPLKKKKALAKFRQREHVRKVRENITGCKCECYRHQTGIFLSPLHFKRVNYCLRDHFHLQLTLTSTLIFSLLLPLVRSINTQFFPCDTDANGTSVDCYGRPFTAVPRLHSLTVVSLNLSHTRITRVRRGDFSGLPNLRRLLMAENCPPPGRCKMHIDHDAFLGLSQLHFANLSGNSLTSIPWLPESLKVLDLQKNHIFAITTPLGTPRLEMLYLNGNCFYANPCSKPFLISEDVLRKLPRLKHLALGYNNVTAVPTGLPGSLRHLNLRENAIREIPEEAFANLTNLKFLSVEWNCQRCDHAARPCFPCPNNSPLKLHPLSFYSHNSSVTFLSLRGNSLQEIPPGLFRPLKKLKKLDLSDNLLSDAIQNGSFFSELTGLSWISLIYNYKPLLTFRRLNLSRSLANISGLECLLLSGNFFRTLSDESLDVLSNLKNLKKLELRMNFIESFNMSAVARLPSLDYVDLSQNVLSFLPCCVGVSPSTEAQGGDCQNRNQLGLPENPLPLRGRDAAVWGSGGPELADGAVSRPSSLWWRFCNGSVSYDLSQNNIMHLHRSLFKGFENAVCLDLSYNYISQALRQGVFSDMERLVFLNLSFNRLDLYYNDSFRELNSTLRVLDLSNNQFHFMMLGMGHNLHFIQNLTSLEFLSLANNLIGIRVNDRLVSSSVTHLDFSGNQLNIMWESDNTKYTHYFQNLTSLMYLDISRNHLKSITPKQLCNLPSSIQNLIASSNVLKFFPWTNISVLSNLRCLDLSQNHLSYLPREVVSFGESFSTLDLSHNHITRITQEFFNNVSSLRYLYLSHNLIKEINQQFLPSPFKNGSGLRTLTLHANLFKCDCDTSWFADFLKNTPIEIPYLTTFLLCEYPESLQHRSVLSIDQHSCQDIYGGLAFLVSSVLVLVFTLLPLLKHLYGWDLWYCLQVLWAEYKGYSQIADKNSGCHYDAFVVFDTSNPCVRDWVYSELMVNLENSPHRKFCLCLEERDWDLGLSCIDNLHNAVYSSAKTVFVLSTSAPGGEPVTGTIRQTFFMVQQRLLDEKVGDVGGCCRGGTRWKPDGDLLPPAGGHGRSGPARRDVSEAEVPPAEETAVQEVCTLLAQEPKGTAPFLEPSADGLVFGQRQLLRRQNQRKLRQRGQALSRQSKLFLFLVNVVIHLNLCVDFMKVIQ